MTFGHRSDIDFRFVHRTNCKLFARNICICYHQQRGTLEIVEYMNSNALFLGRHSPDNFSCNCLLRVVRVMLSENKISFGQIFPEFQAGNAHVGVRGVGGYSVCCGLCVCEPARAQTHLQRYFGQTRVSIFCFHFRHQVHNVFYLAFKSCSNRKV